jgi:rhamnosyl/mannosyltransferase
MRVLHFYRTYLPDTVGGAEQAIYHLCRAGADQGVENTVLTLTAQRNAPSRVNLPGHTVERVPSGFSVASVELSLGVIRRFRRLAREADVIHYHFPWPMSDIAQLVSGVRKPSIVTYHADIQRQPTLLAMYKPLMRRFLASVDRIVATSPNYVTTSEVLREHRDKVEVVPLGLTRNFYPKPDEALLQKWRERTGGGPFFLFVGVFRYYKGLNVLLEAIQRTGYPVVLVGDGPLAPELRAYAQQHGVTNALFTGALPEEDKMALIELSRAIVFPSPNRAEAFGMTLLEGSMLGKPMITCEIGTGTSYVNRHGETGLVCAPNDPEDLARAMKEMWDDPHWCELMGRRAALRFEDLFTAHRTARAYRRIYDAVVAEHARGPVHAGAAKAAEARREPAPLSVERDTVIEEKS